MNGRGHKIQKPATNPRNIMTLNDNTNIEKASPINLDIYYEMCFAPIDTMVDWRLQRFPFTMLQVGKILLKKEYTVREVSATRISRIMYRHRNEMFGSYTAGEICKAVQYGMFEILGAGIRIDWAELNTSTLRNPKYDFDFTAVFRPEDYVVKEPVNQLITVIGKEADVVGGGSESVKKIC